MTVLEKYRYDYEIHTTYSNGDSKYEWAASHVFELFTYDGMLDERFVKAIIEVSKAILDGRTYEYIEDERNYVKYILVCQLLDMKGWINWGTSIRGAWFDVGRTRHDHILDMNETVPFTVENLKALIEFIEEEE